MTYVHLFGNMTADPTLRDANGTNVASFSMASRTTQKLSDGTYQSDFYDISVWGRQAEYIMAHAQKGTACNVRGELVKNEYKSKSGETRVALRVRADNVELVNRLKDASSAPAAKSAPKRAAQIDDDLTDDMFGV